MTVRLGLRLAVAGGRESLLRLALMAVGVGVGVLLLLLGLTGQSAAQGRGAVRVAERGLGDTGHGARCRTVPQRDRLPRRHRDGSHVRGGPWASPAGAAGPGTPARTG
jgi:hypothetical protein